MHAQAHIVFMGVESSGKAYNGASKSKTERKHCPAQPL